MVHSESRLEYEICPVRIDDEVVRPLLEGLSGEYLARYGEIDEMNQSRPSEFEPPGGAFFAILDAGTIVAGGGYRRFSDDACEMKRVWTSPSRRRRGLAGVILSVLEAAAAEAGYERVVLETGPNQPEAVAFYESRGYRRIPVYGRYERALAFARELDGALGTSAPA